jgi:hypothetical protein
MQLAPYSHLSVPGIYVPNVYSLFILIGRLLVSEGHNGWSLGFVGFGAVFSYLPCRSFVFFHNVVNTTKIVDWVALGMAQCLLFFATSFARCWFVVRLARSHCSICLNLPPRR